MKNGSTVSRRRIAVVSPFIDKRHGTERAVAECFSRLVDQYDIHIYSQRVEDMDLSRVTWHRIPALPGPHLLGYLWWFAANHIWRWRDRKFRDLAPDVVISPGINCLDAGAILVHVVFGHFREQMREQLQFRGNPIRTWHLILHRRLYYALIHSLERRIYTRTEIPLAVVSHKTAENLARCFGRNSNILLLRNGLDLERFHLSRREALRPEARRTLGLESNKFVILLIGNDWKSKGLPCLIEAVGRLARPEVRVLVVGRDSPVSFQAAIVRSGLSGGVRFLPPRPDVEFYYAASDVYASPTRDDAFALPPAEAMACGLPVITSRNNGGADIITPGVDGFVLDNAEDVATLADILRRLLEDVTYRQEIGLRAFQAVQQLNWDASAAVMRQLLEQVCHERRPAGS